MVSEHNVPSLQAANVQRRDRLTVWVARRLYRRATGVLAVSHPVAGELVSAFRVPARNLFVVPNPIVPSPAEARVPAGRTPTHLHLVFVGRQVRQKRPHLFLDVLHELAQRGVAVRGTVIGDGPLFRSTEQKASRLGLDVSFLGWKEPWWEAVSDVDCLVLTANAEGLANVLVEAAAAGISSVASSRALGVADAIVPGITGEFAMGDSPQAYADAVLAAPALGATSTVRIDAWLNRFSTTASTATLFTALRAVAEPTQA
jgi:glycosyltransferase involved in cell wall biosynthesis